MVGNRIFGNGQGVNAIAKPARFRTIGKNVSKMVITGISSYLYTIHSMRTILVVSDGVFLSRLAEGGPTCPAIKFPRRIKQRRPAADT